MSNYRTADEVASLLFDDNQDDSSTSDRLNDDDDCSDYVPSDDDNEEDIILSDPEYDFKDNNDNAETSDASGRYITNTSTAIFTSKTGVESWAAEPLLPLTSKTSQRNTGWAVSCAPKNLKQIKGRLKLKINFDWNQSNLKVIVTDTFKKKKRCFVPLFLQCFH